MTSGEPSARAPERVSPPAGTAAARLKILSLTTAYPNANEPGVGIFIRSRLAAMATQADIRVLAPVSALRFADWKNGWRGPDQIPGLDQDGAIPVLRCHWIYPPLAGAANGVFLFLQLVRSVAALRRQFPFQVIDAHFGFPEAVTAALLARRFGVPFTVTLRGSEVDHARYFLRRPQMAWALRRASRVIAVSERLRLFAISLGVSPDRAVAIPNGIDNSIFFRRDRTSCRKKHGIGPAEQVILSAGNLIELKGHHRVVRCIEELVATGTEVRLLIAGGPGRGASYEPEIRRQAAARGLGDKVCLLGAVPPDTLAELMSAADVLCLASSREGWPNVVHEAMSCGTPVVATDVGAIPEMIPSDDYGLVVPVANQPFMVDALRRALSKQWGHDAIAAFAQRRSWSQVAQEAIGLLNAVTKDRVDRDA